MTVTSHLNWAFQICSDKKHPNLIDYFRNGASQL
jgi:hypothetical protein